MKLNERIKKKNLMKNYSKTTSKLLDLQLNSNNKKENFI